MEQDRFLKIFRKVDKYFGNGVENNTPLKAVLGFIKLNTSYPKQDPDGKHHALADAIWISKLYSYLKSNGQDL